MLVLGRVGTSGVGLGGAVFGMRFTSFFAFGFFQTSRLVLAVSSGLWYAGMSSFLTTLNLE